MRASFSSSSTTTTPSPSPSSTTAKNELQHLLTTPPSNVPNINPATIAHSALERLRDTGDETFLFLRTIFEILHSIIGSDGGGGGSSSSHHHGHHRNSNYNSDDELLLFHCITGCRYVLLHGWRRYNTHFKYALRDWMMLLGHLFSGVTSNSNSNNNSNNNNAIPQNRTLQMACYTTSVAFWKRSWLDYSNSNDNNNLEETSNVVDMTQQQQSLLQAMQQISSSSSSSSSSLFMNLIPDNLRNNNGPIVPFLSNPMTLFRYLEQCILEGIVVAAESTPTSTTTTTTTTAAATQLSVPTTIYLQALVEEFAGTKSSVTYQLPLEFHKQIRQSFESTTTPSSSSSSTTMSGLNSCLQLSMKTLGQILPTLLSSQQQQQQQQQLMLIGQNCMQITCECLGWEFGMDAFVANNNVPSGNGKSGSSSSLIRPPREWQQYHITTPGLAQALWSVHNLSIVRDHNHPFAHTIRQLILLLASIEGPIFTAQQQQQQQQAQANQQTQQRKDFLASILQGTLELLQVQVSAFTITTAASSWQEAQWTELLDTLTILSRIIANGKWPLLIQFHKDPLLPGLLNGLTAIGRTIWEQHVQEGQTLQGDLEMMEYGDMREDVLNQLLEAVVTVTGDPWLWYSGNTVERTWARQLVGQSLVPLYGIWIQGRTQLAGWEEHYLCRNAKDNDVEEDYEHISAVQLQEEMESLSTLGRVHIKGSIQSLSTLFQQTIPQLQAQWNGNAGTTATGEVSPELAALLEQARLLTLYIGHLLTDDNSGETPVIPDVVAIACREEEEDTIPTIVSAIEALFSLAQTQAVKLAEQPNDPRLSPLLGNSFLWCLIRWAPAYIYSVDYSGNSAGGSTSLPTSHTRNIGAVWSSQEKAQQAVSFAITLCLHFQCYWPQERPVQESATALLLSLAKRAAGSDHHHHATKIRTLMVASPSFMQMLLFHCLTAGTRHSMSRSELEQTIYAKASEANTSVDMNMITGYQRLPYDIKSKILSALLVACSEPQTEHLWKDCLKAVQDSFSSLVHALSTKQVSASDVNAKEMTCLCVEMFRGVARASEMAEPSRVPVFITPNLPSLSGLMHYHDFADDISICERLLQLFRDYTEQFVIMLNREQCLALFQASAALLKSYSTHHCNSKTRVIAAKSTEEANLEEEQKYGDILCAIQLLIHLGTKDFIDLCSSSSNPGVDSTQVTDVIFFGLQQILPLMTQGLLQMPTLCSQYFSLVGFMMDTYPEKIAVLPYELFDALVESLLFGMCHHDPTVAKSSLQGIASITREHTKSHILAAHLARNPEFIDKCTIRLLRDVVFQNKVWDRLEAAGMALLSLAAVDLNRFAAVVQHLVEQVPVEDQKARLRSSFESLMQTEVLHKVESGGLEGRRNRIRFKKDFEVFCHEVHSFLILK